ncbi:MAG TPA: hypothetical protein PK580_04750 [Nitrosomonas halophila]|nr:hypothetical protein [Nitrosomonas halophila]
MVKLTRKILLQALCVCLTAFSPAWSFASVQLIAEVGQAAEDFPPGYVYWGFDHPVMGPSGHIAFSGAADTSVRATDNHTHAVWSGRPGHLKALIKENEVLIHTPQTLRFLSAVESSLITNSSGHVAMMARLQSDLNSNHTIGLLIHADGHTHLALQTGQPAPGLPSGTVIHTIRDFVFTTAGLLILAEASGPSFQGLDLWFWNFSELTKLPTPSSHCSYADINSLSLNQRGAATFIASLSHTTGGACDPSRGVFKWHDGQIRTIVSDNAPVPGMAATVFSLNSYPLRASITDLDEIIFTAVLMDTIDSEWRSSAWVARSDGQLDLLVLDGESLPDNTTPGNRLNNPDFFANIESTDSGLSILKTTREANRSTAITMGRARAIQPYHSIHETGTSQLSLITQLNDPLPGFDASWFTGILTGEVAINKAGQFAFSSIIASESDILGTRRTAIWRGTENGETELAASVGMTLFVNNEVRKIEQINRLNRFVNLHKSGGSTVGGGVTQFSDQGEIIFAGNLENNPGGIFLVTDGKKEGRVFTLAEQLFPALFSPANPHTQNAQGFWYRYYPATHSYIGIRGQEVFVLGDAFGSGIQYLDTLDNILHFLEGIAQPGS